MIKKINVPKLRFKEFDREWNYDLAEKLCQFSKGKGYSKNDLTNEGHPILLYGSMYTNYKNTLTNVKTLVSEVREGTCYSKKGDVVVPSSGETRNDISRATCIENDGIILGGDLNILHPNEELNSLFLALSITYGNGHRRLSRLAQGNSVVHLYNSDLKTLKVVYPGVYEQIKICSFFTNIDKLIKLQTEKLEQLKKLKQGYLQKMFPQDVELVPILRFSEFNDDWIENTIGNLALVTKLAGFEFSKYVKYSDEGNIVAIRGLNVKNDSLDLSDVKYIDYSDFSKLKRSKLFTGDILFTYVGTVGNSAIIKENNKFYLAPNVALIRIKNNDLISSFFQKEISTDRYFRKVVYPLAASSSQMALSMESIRKFKLLYCSIDEQEKIGEFFSKLDLLINDQSNKIDVLKQQKKAYLQKMFI